MINFVRNSFALLAVDDFLYFELCFDPFRSSQRLSKPLSSLSLATAASDNFFNRDC